LATNIAARSQRLVASVILEVPAVDVLHHQKRPIAVEVEVVNPDQVGMLQIDQQPALRDQTGLVFSAARPSTQFEHQIIAQLEVDNPIDVRLAAAVDPADDLVLADGIRQLALSFSTVSRRGLGRIFGLPGRGRPAVRRFARLNSIRAPHVRIVRRPIVEMPGQRLHLSPELLHPLAARRAPLDVLKNRGFDRLFQSNPQELRLVRTCQTRRHG
jgi:hypothetical protein